MRRHLRVTMVAVALLAMGLVLPSYGAAVATGPRGDWPGVGDSKLFDTWVGYPAGRYLSASEAADFDGDGSVDVAWARQDWVSNAMVVQLNMGDGTLGPPAKAPAMSNSRDIASGDLDGDVDLDLVVVSEGTSYTNATIDVYVNNGAGRFTRFGVPGGYGPRSVALADLDADGDLDMAVTNYGRTDVSILRNRGNARFSKQARVVVGDKPAGIASGDLDGDGDVDLAVARFDAVAVKNKVSVLVNDGTGRFVVDRTVTVNVSIMGNIGDPPVVAGDWDGDGDADLAVGSIGTELAAILTNTGGLAFTQKTVNWGYSVFGMRAADLEGDGDVDLMAATSDSASGTVSVLRNNGNGTFAPELSLESGNLPYDVAVGDFNGDGLGDLAVANRLTDTGAIHPQHADGSFAVATLVDNDSWLPNSVAVADFDLDGDPDVAEGSDNIHLLFNKGDATFTLGSTVNAGGGTVKAPWASDLNGDGAPDLVWTPDVPPYPFAYALNAGDGTFGPTVKVPIQTCGTGAASTADVDDDGDQDVLVANMLGGPSSFCEQVSTTVRVSLNNGDGTFQPDYGVKVHSLPMYAIAQDVTGDGVLDLIASSTMVSVARGLGGGSFASYEPWDARGTELATADLDGDADLDIVAADGSYSVTSVLLNDGTGRFPQIDAYPNEFTPGLVNGATVALGDLDGDGTIDIALGNGSGNNMAVHFGMGDGSFDRSQIRYGANNDLGDVVLVDLNADGLLDAVGPASVGSSFVTPRGVQVFVNQG